MYFDSIRRRWTRLTGMSSDEMHSRIAQEFHKRSDLARTKLGNDLGHFPQTSIPGNFLFKPSGVEEILTCLRSRVPDTVAEILLQADRVCAHRFDLLGYSNLDFGSPIDWHKDPVSGKSAPLKPWYKIPFLDYAQVGDVKVTWELNRHQHLVTLAKAYRLSGEQRYADELINQWKDWSQANPYPIGVNWASSLEVAFRSLSWLWVRALLEPTAAAPPPFWNELEHALNLSARHLSRYLSTYFSPNTHLMGEGVALFFIGTLSKASEAKLWRDLGWQIVQAEADRQVQPDGFHFEQSTYYHVYAIDFFLHSLLLARANSIEVPQRFEQTLLRMLDALATLSYGALPPRFGDDDGGRLFDGRRNHPEHLTDPLVTGSVLFKRGDFKALHPRLIEETIWLLGPQGAQAFEHLAEVQPGHPPICSLNSGGVHVMSDREGTRRLVFDTGEQGAHGGGHSHADALAIQLIIDGQEVLTDSGTYAYVSGGDDRCQFRSTLSHNTVAIDELDQMDAKGAFPWASKARVVTDRKICGQHFTLIEAHHDGYRRLPDPVTHSRAVFHLHDRFWLIHDHLNGHQTHQVELRWHFAPGLSISTGTDSALVKCERSVLNLTTEASSQLKMDSISGKFSPVYGQQVPCDVLRVSGRIPLPASISTLLTTNVQASQSSLSRTEDAHLTMLRFVNETGVHVFLFNRDRTPLTMGDLKADADFIYIGRKREDHVHIILCNVRSARCGDETLFDLEDRMEYFESVQDGLHHGVWQSKEFAFDEDVLNSLMRLALANEGTIPVQG